MQPEQMMNGEQRGDQKNAEEILRNINKISVANNPHSPPTRLQTTLIPSKKHSTCKQHENQTIRTKKQERNRHLTRWIRKNRLDGADEKTKWGKRKAPGLKKLNPCDKKMGALPKKLNKEADKLGPQKACRQKQKSSKRQIRRVEAKQLRYRTVAKIE